MQDRHTDGRKDKTKRIVALHYCFANVSIKKMITENGKE